jgi:uncharacterized membrane protein
MQELREMTSALGGKAFFTTRRVFLFGVSAFSFLFVVIFTLKGIQIHEIFGTSAYDLGLFDQTLWLTSRFEMIFNTVRGLHAHGDHFKPIQYIYVPLYLIYPSIYWALLLQSFSVGAAAVVLFYIAEKFMPDENLVPGMFACCFLLNPVVHNTLLWQYHDIVLAYPLFFLMMLFYLRNDLLKYVVTLVLVLCCREDMPFIVIGMGVVAIIQRKWKFAAWTIFLSLVWFLAAFYVIMPYLNHKGYFRHQNGVLQTLFMNLWNPDYYVQRFSSKEGQLYLWCVFYPLIGLYFLQPLYLLPSIAALAVNVLIGGYQTQIGYHYSVNVMPFVFFASVAGFAKLKNSISDVKTQKMLCVVVLSLLLGAHIHAFLKLSVLKPGNFKSDIKEWRNLSPVRKEIIELKTQIGARGVAATDFILPHFAHRKHIYLFPNPWKIHYWGIAGEAPHHPNNVDVIILYKNEYIQHARILNYLLSRGFFKQTGKSDRFLIFERIRLENPSRESAVTALEKYFADAIPAFAHTQISRAFDTEFDQFGVSHMDIKNPFKDHELQWMPVNNGQGSSFSIDFCDYFPACDSKTVYIASEIYAPTPCDAVLMTGSDDGLTIWINGEKKLEKLVSRPAGSCDDILEIKLRKGVTKILFRINNAAGAWRLNATIEPLKLIDDTGFQ